MIEWLRDEQQNPAITLSGRLVPIALKRHARAKRMTLRLASDGSAVQITVPPWCRSKDAIAFAESRVDWLEEQLAKIPARECPISRGSLRFRGNEVALAWNETAPRRAKLAEGTLSLGGPHETLLRRLQRWLEAEAQPLMEADLAFFCGAAELDTRPLRLTRAKRRWGSCSSEGTVRINWRLIQAPDFVRRSVVAHEVAHLVHFDHSPAFHAMLAAIYDDDIAKADAWLKANGRRLYTDFG
ncbi:M48 family metallopeptidase [Erythrobacter sp. W53]|uniref:M48 family metallopeptidase n=1 Tax=Erythrobacter sp. W53 TaxID=3425947 RepID=UPI003D768AC9